MKKLYKLCFLSILVFMLTGCGWDDVYKEHKKVLDKGVNCEYTFSKAENIDCGKNSDCSDTAAKTIKLKADSKAFYVNSEKINSNIISLGVHNEVLLDKFDYNKFLDDYEDSGECPNTISYGGMDGSNNTYLYYTNNSGAWKFIYTINKEKEEQNTKPNDSGTATPNQGDNSGSTSENPQSEFNSSCQSARAISCKQYTLVETHDKTVYIELGRQKTTSNEIREYFVVSYNANFEGASVVYKDDTAQWPLISKLSPSSEGYQHGSQTFYVTDEQFDLLFVGNDKYTDKLYAQYDNMDLDESPNYYLRSTPFEGDDSIFEGGVSDGNIENELPNIELNKVTCATIFKENGKYNDTHKLLSGTLKFMQYIGVILALVLSVIDFIKVVPTNDKDALMKSVKSAALRLGIAIIIFFVPIILDFILELVGFNDPTCGLL